MKVTKLDQIKIVKYLDCNGLENIFIRDIMKLSDKYKYSHNDLLLFFYELIISSLEKEKINEKRIIKIIDLIRQIIASNNIEKLNKEVLEKLKDLKDLFCSCNIKSDAILKDLSTLHDEIFFEKEDIDEHLKERNLQDQSMKIEKLQKTQSKILEQIKKYKDKIERQNKKEKLLKEQIKNYEAKISDYENQISNLNINLEGEQEKVESLNRELNNLCNDLDNLKESLKSLENEKNNSINLLRQDYEALRKEYQKLEKENLALKGLVSINDKLKERDTYIKNEMVKHLFKGTLRLDLLEKELKKIGINISFEELYQILMSLKANLNIKLKVGINGPEYILQNASIEKNKNYEIDVSDNNLDILLISDVHIKEYNCNILREYESVIEYCMQNNISIILNLGDFLDLFCYCDEHTHENYKRIMEIVDKYIENLASVRGIYNLVLGGNHDEDLTALGVDMLKYFSEKREDFISLGYEKAIIDFKMKSSNVGKILIAHPNKLLGRDFLYNKKLKLIENLGYDLNCYDFFYLGHSHERYLDINQKILVLPSLSMDRFMKGAVHIKFHFDKSHIVSQEFRSLVLSEQYVGHGYSVKRLIPSGKTIYQHKL